MPQRAWPVGPASSRDRRQTTRERLPDPAAPVSPERRSADRAGHVAVPEPGTDSGHEPGQPANALPPLARQPAGARPHVAVPEPGQGWPGIGVRGAASAMLALFLVGNLLAGWLGLDALAGLGFAAGCLLAAVCTRRRDLLLMITMPPILFLAAVLGTEALTSAGSTFATSAQAIAAGTVLTLSAAAPWLFCGVVLCVAIATFRGLPQCVRDMRMGLRGQAADADRAR